VSILRELVEVDRRVVDGLPERVVTCLH